MKPAVPENVTLRRILAGVLVFFGAALIFLAPETWSGVVLLGLGVVFELSGMVINHQLSRRNRP